jgi:hypothetical protein
MARLMRASLGGADLPVASFSGRRSTRALAEPAFSLPHVITRVATRRKTRRIQAQCKFLQSKVCIVHSRTSLTGVQISFLASSQRHKVYVPLFESDNNCYITSPAC